MCRLQNLDPWRVFVEWAELIATAPSEESLLVCSLLVLASQFCFACAYVRVFACLCAWLARSCVCVWLARSCVYVWLVRSCVCMYARVRVRGSRVRVCMCVCVYARACVFPQCYWFFAVTSVTAMKKMEKSRVWIQRCASKIGGICRGSSCCHSGAKWLWQLIWVGCVCNLLK